VKLDYSYNEPTLNKVNSSVFVESGSSVQKEYMMKRETTLSKQLLLYLPKVIVPEGTSSYNKNMQITVKCWGLY